MKFRPVKDKKRIAASTENTDKDTDSSILGTYGAGKENCKGKQDKINMCIAGTCKVQKKKINGKKKSIMIFLQPMQ